MLAKTKPKQRATKLVMSNSPYKTQNSKKSKYTKYEELPTPTYTQIPNMQLLRNPQNTYTKYNKYQQIPRKGIFGFC